MTITEVNEKLAELGAKIHRKSYLESERKELELALSNAQTEEKVLLETLQKEQKDVDKLERLSFVSLFHSFKGSKDAEHNKQVNELMAAKTKLNRFRAEFKQIEEDLTSVCNELDKIATLENTYHQLNNEKKGLIRSQSNKTGALLDTKISEYETLKKQQKEVKEALQAGRTTSKLLYEAIDMLRSASRWATYDALSNNGLLSHLVKYNRIERAQALLARVRSSIKRFKRELIDVDVNRADLGVHISDTMRAFDFWFDNIFTDFKVLNRINDSLRNAEDTLAKVNKTISEIKSHEVTLLAKLKGLKKDIETIVNNA